jgi:hypothetical protein
MHMSNYTYNQITADRRMFDLIEKRVHELYSALETEITKLISEGIIPDGVELERGKSVMVKVDIFNLLGNSEHWWYKTGWESPYKRDGIDNVIMKKTHDDWLKEWSEKI